MLPKNKLSKRIRRVTYDTVCNDFIFQQIPPKTTCLDVGCWSGNLGHRLVNEKHCQVDGLDQDEDALAIAKCSGYRHLFHIDINHSSSEIQSKITLKYDVIICADVLEHLVDPEKLLNLLKNNLKKDGAIYISIPNIAFLLYRIKLLIGQFDYNPSGGVMDATHLRFYTAKTIKNLCQKAGFKIEIFQGYNLVRKEYQFLNLLSKISPAMFSLQFYLKLTR